MSNLVVEDLKVAELKEELTNRGLDTTGVKKILVERLKAAMESENSDQQNLMNIKSDPDNIMAIDDDTNKEAKSVEDQGTDLDNNKSDDGIEEKQEENEELVEKNEQDEEPSETDNALSVVEGKETVEQAESCNENTESKSVDEKLTDEVDEEIVQSMMTNYDEDLDYDLDEPNESKTVSKEESAEKTEPKEAVEKKKEVKDDSKSKDSSSSSIKDSKVKSEPRNLWISNLSEKTKAADLKQYLSVHGKVVSVSIVAKGTVKREFNGFVVMHSSYDAKSCISALDGKEWNGVTLHIELTEKESIKKTSDKSKISPINGKIDEEGEKLLAKIEKRKSDLAKKIVSASTTNARRNDDIKLLAHKSASNKNRRAAVKRAMAPHSSRFKIDESKRSKDFFENRIKKPFNAARNNRNNRELRPVIEQLRARRKSIDKPSSITSSSRRRSPSRDRLRVEPKINRSSKRYSPVVPARRNINVPTPALIPRRRSRSPLPPPSYGRGGNRSPIRRSRSPRHKTPARIGYRRDRSPPFNQPPASHGYHHQLDKRPDAYSPEGRRRTDMYESDFGRRPPAIDSLSMKRDYSITEKYDSYRKSPGNHSFDYSSSTSKYIDYRNPVGNSRSGRSPIDNGAGGGDRYSKYPVIENTKPYYDDPRDRVHTSNPHHHHLDNSTSLGSMSRLYQDDPRRGGKDSGNLSRSRLSPPSSVDRRRDYDSRRDSDIRRDVRRDHDPRRNADSFSDRRSTNYSDVNDRRPVSTIRYDRSPSPRGNHVNNTSTSGGRSRNSGSRWPEVVDYMHRSSTSTANGLYSSNNGPVNVGSSLWQTSPTHNHNNSTAQLLASAQAALQNVGIVGMMPMSSSRHNQSRNY